MARRALAINPYNPYAHVVLVAALALTGHDAEAREALQRYLALSTASLQDDRGMEGAPDVPGSQTGRAIHASSR